MRLPVGARRLAGRAAWVTADTALSSLSNAALGLVVASQVSDVQYGAFALAFSLYGFAITVVQSLAGQVLLVRYASADPDRHRSAGRVATGASAVVSLTMAAALLVAGLLAQDPLRPVLLALAVLLPGLLVQETWRSVFISRGTPRQAFANDAVWLVLQVVAIGTLLALDQRSALAFTLAWGGAAVAAAGFASLQARSVPTFRGLRGWFRGHRDISLPTLANVFAVNGSVQLAFVLVAVIGTLADVGAIRAAQTLLGPLNVVGFAATAFTIPEVARRTLSGRRLLAVAAALSTALVLVTLAWGGTLLLLPDSVGSAVLGDTWDAARRALPLMVAFTVLVAVSTGPLAMCRAWGRASYAFWAGAVQGPAVLGLSAVGVHLAGAPGAAAGFLAAAAVTAPVSWYLVTRAARLGPSPSPGDPVPAEQAA